MTNKRDIIDWVANSRSAGIVIGLLLSALVLWAGGGCAPSPMADWRQEVVDECGAARDYMLADCPPGPYAEPACGDEVSATEACMGAQERVYQCHQTAIVTCTPWGPDVGLQCDEPEWALRTCLWPELLKGGA